MADEQHEIRHIHWNEVFSFTQVFKSFRLAIHPSKLILALMAIVLVFAGGWVMDNIWSLGNVYVMNGEITLFTQCPSAVYSQQVENWKDARTKNSVALYLRWQEISNLDEFRDIFTGSAVSAFDALKTEAQGRPAVTAVDTANRNWPSLLADARSVFNDTMDDAERLLTEAEERERENARTLVGDSRRERLDAIHEDVVKARQGLTRMAEEFELGAHAPGRPEVLGVRDIRGRPIFASLLEFEANCLHNGLFAARYGNIFGGLDEYGKTGAVSPDPGFLFYVVMAFHGVLWLACTHWLYAVIFLVFSLAVWALFGGAICRIAALHAAREEKISIAQALRFSVGKFLSFFMAPLIPVGVIVIIGLMMLAGGLIANIPAAGPVIVGLLFFLAILGGLAIAFLLFGLIGGGSLMYPTIAVEGSDSFDAISRSYSYIFNRPWRAGLYGLVAVIYGSMCYLFVRLFAFVTLKAAHIAVKAGVWTGGQRLAGAADKIDVMWKAPTFGNLHGGMSTAAMGWSEIPGAWLIYLWVYLVIGLVAAFLIAYFCSASTMIYYLLRRQVDATDLDDVYVAEAPEEQIEATPAPEAEEAQDEAEGDEGPQGQSDQDE